MAGFVSQSNEGTTQEGLGLRITIRVPSAATEGRMAAIEMVAPAGFVAPPFLHRHTDLDWQGHVLDGAVAMILDGQRVTIEAGGLVVVPRGTAFQWWNASADRPVRWLCTYAPGGFENYFGEVATALQSLGRPPTREDLMAVVPPLWKRYNIEMVPG
jgi:mannose-6-phosphate isomerase-like protein (cupin superfamily)